MSPGLKGFSGGALTGNGDSDKISPRDEAAAANRSRPGKCQHISGNNLKHHAGSTSQLISSEAAKQRPAELEMLMESS